MGNDAAAEGVVVGVGRGGSEVAEMLPLLLLLLARTLPVVVTHSLAVSGTAPHQTHLDLDEVSAASVHRATLAPRIRPLHLRVIKFGNNNCDLERAFFEIIFGVVCFLH